MLWNIIVECVGEDECPWSLRATKGLLIESLNARASLNAIMSFIMLEKGIFFGDLSFYTNQTHKRCHMLAAKIAVGRWCPETRFRIVPNSNCCPKVASF